MSLTNLAFRSLRARPLRAVLSTLGVALGVAVLFAGMATSAGVDASVRSTVNDLVGRSDLLRQVSRGARYLDDLDLNPLLADLHLGNREEALQTAHWAARLQPHFWLGRQVLAASLSAAGDVQAASAAVAALQRDYPGLTAEQFVNWFPYAGGHGGALVTEALRRAGWR
jgi:hypothetical protein